MPLRALLALLLLSAGCRFDPSAAPIAPWGPDARADQAADRPGDGLPERGSDDGITERGPDRDGPPLAPDLPRDGLKSCPVCLGLTPVCNTATGLCRACATHAECPGGLCAANGSCPAEAQISHVDAAKCPTSNKDGSKAQPYCLIDEAVGKSKLYILVRAGLYAKDLTLDGVTHELHGLPGAVIKPTGCDKLEIKGAASVHLQGFTIDGNVRVTAGSTTLVQNVIGPSSCVGVKSAAPATVALRRNFIVKNTLGGLDLADNYQVVNNIIARNSTVATTFGGVKLAGSGTFVNNTVADNECKGSNPAEACGVRCEVQGTKLVNNIFWGNGFNDTGDTATDRQHRTDRCVAEYSLEQLKSGAKPTGVGNITAASAGFVGATPATAAEYHILPGSPARNKGTAAGAPVTDYDGEPRSDGLIDIGADERP